MAKIRKLEAKSFKRIREVVIDCAETVITISGANANGKSSVLDAVAAQAKGLSVVDAPAASFQAHSLLLLLLCEPWASSLAVGLLVLLLVWLCFSAMISHRMSAVLTPALTMRIRIQRSMLELFAV